MVGYEQLVEIFFATHDPTTRNRQGADVGTQYRSAIFVTDKRQQQSVESVMRRLENDGVFDKPIVTETLPARSFYPAESYHQEFYKKNPDQSYCQVVITPKLAKLRKSFAPLLKKA